MENMQDEVRTFVVSFFNIRKVKSEVCVSLRSNNVSLSF